MSDQIELSPCPFCEGPPVVFSKCDDAGDFAEAFVFCHECGAQGPSEDGFVYELGEVEELGRLAAIAWNERNNRHRDLYDGSENVYP